ncbi:MAG: acetylornithine deacetylase [Pseudomonadota bacterium]
MTHPRLAETEALLAELVAFPTVSAASNRALTDRLAERLEGLGARVRVDPDPTGAKANLWASLGPERAPEEDRGIVLSGHTDVVPPGDGPWTGDPFRLREAGGRLYGRGTCDMKGFVACATAIAAEAAERPLAHPLHLAFTYDEEVGCFGAKAMVAALSAEGRRPAMAIIGEPTAMRVIEGHKGNCEYHTRIAGLPGHSARPDLCVSAADAAVRYAARLLQLGEALKARAPRGSRFEPPHATLNIGRIDSGTVHNVIAERAHIAWEVRTVSPGDAAFVCAEIDAHAEALLGTMRAVYPGAAIERITIGDVPGLEPAQDNAARDVALALTGPMTGETEALHVAFGTEAGLYRRLGLSAVVCGPGDIAQAHRADEFVARSQLDACLTMLSGLVARLAG